MKRVLKKIFGDPQAKELKKLTARVAGINVHTEEYSGMKVQELRGRIDAYKKELTENKKKQKAKLDKILPDVFAIVREASDQVLGLRPFDVQLIGGMALHDGNVAEMRTGEGKTLVATLPVILNALTGKGVHVVTVNDYLAQRDAGWMAGLYSAVGLSTAVIIAENSYIYDEKYTNDEHDDERFIHLKPCTRKEAYAADITYGTNNEFGFDYLRDNMVREADQLRQRELNYAIVDEVDSILIDEARTPLIISAPASSSASAYSTFAQVTRKLVPDDYELDEKRKAVGLNDDGIKKVQEVLGVENLYSPENVQMIYHMDQALRAETLFKRDKDYVVTEDGEVIIIDEFTGRMMHGRRYNEGLHQAIEAKEGVEVQQESMTLATISFQNLFRLYDKLSGMTGTAATEAEEFQQIYDLDVIEIPTNQEIMRDDLPDRIYKSRQGKFKAIVEEVKALKKKGQPVLIGTASIDMNETLSQMLARAGVEHSVLNAKNNEGEAAIIAKAGRIGAVTIATNIAGRGTDIVLEEGVTDLGGLFVLGSERHESRRIDNQLRGRCGRQGDPGMTQFYVSAEDDLMRIFNGPRIAGLMERLGVSETTPIENRSLSKAIENAQKKVESMHFDSRKNVVQYDDVMNKHRGAVYTTRKEILMKDDISKNIEELIASEVAVYTSGPEETHKSGLKDLEAAIPLSGSELKKLSEIKKSEELTKAALEASLKLYKKREKEFTPNIMRMMESDVYLQILDTNWMQHLENMDHLRQGIGLRSIGQRDPLVEYRREGQTFFEAMQSNVQNEVVRTLFRIEPRPQVEVLQTETELTKAAERSVEGGQSATKESKKNTATKPNKKEARTVRSAEAKDHNNKLSDARKKKKKQRKNKKKGRH